MHGAVDAAISEPGSLELHLEPFSSQTFQEMDLRLESSHVQTFGKT